MPSAGPCTSSVSPKARRTSSKFSRKFSLPMNRHNQNPVALAKIHLPQCLSDEGRAAPDDPFHQHGLARRRAFAPKLGLRLQDDPWHFFYAFDAGDGTLHVQLIAGRKA